MARDMSDEAIFASLFRERLGKGEQTKAKILKEAIKVIGREGIEKLTFDRIARPLKMSAGQVQYHFKNKADIVAAAIEFVVQSLQHQIVVHIEKTSGDWKQQLLALVEGYFAGLKTHTDYGGVWLYFHYATVINSELLQTQRQVAQVADERMLAILEPIRQKKGWSRSKVLSISEMLWSVIDGFVLSHLSAPKPKDKDYYRKEALKAIKLVIASIEA